METIDMEDTINRALKLSARLHWPANSVAEVAQDCAAECRWWNSLDLDERGAYLCGAQLSADNLEADWLDFSEIHRQDILNAARAVECWFQARHRA